MIRWSPLQLIGACVRYRWLCAAAAWLSIVFAIAASAVAQAPFLSLPTPIPEQEPITPIPPPPAADPLKLAIGERLFSDTRLSAGGNLACASCHDIHSNGARSNTGTVARPFNTLTVFNAVLSYRLNWEGNFRSLAAQVVSSLENPGTCAPASTRSCASSTPIRSASPSSARPMAASRMGKDFSTRW